MARSNQNHQLILSENDVISAWLSDIHIDAAIFEDVDPINIYNNWCREYDVEDSINAQTEYTGDNFVEHCTNNWHMTDEYKKYPIYDVCIKQCDTIEKKQRVSLEFDLYNERGMLPVLRFLAYMVDVCKTNNIVLGVGRGSSVASYMLFLLGVHRIDSLKYNLDIKEFLK